MVMAETMFDFVILDTTKRVFAEGAAPRATLTVVKTNAEDYGSGVGLWSRMKRLSSVAQGSSEAPFGFYIR